MRILADLKRTILDSLPPALAGRLRGWRAAWSVRTFRRRVVSHDYGGHRLDVLIADPLAAGWYDHDWALTAEVAALRGRNLGPAPLVFDLGAHQGVVALQLAREAGPASRVVALEPSAHNVAVARDNARLNAVNVTVVEAAVADREGTAVFNRGLTGQLDDGTGAGGRIEVRTTTIDRLAAQFGMPDAILLDVEGAELMALRGATAVLAAGRLFVIEVHQGCGLELLGGSVRELLGCLPPERYRLSACEEGEPIFRPLDRQGFPAGRFFLLAEPESPVA